MIDATIEEISDDKMLVAEATRGEVASLGRLVTSLATEERSDVAALVGEVDIRVIALVTSLTTEEMGVVRTLVKESATEERSVSTALVIEMRDDVRPVKTLVTSLDSDDSPVARMLVRLLLSTAEETYVAKVLATESMAEEVVALSELVS